jgi:hypothetical protein
MVKTFDPAQFSCIVGGKIMKGFADGTFIRVERNEQAYNLKVGVDGEGTRVKSNNKSGKVTITLMQSSESNEALSAFAAADELSNSGAVPLLLKDGTGTTIMSAATAWVQKYPDAEFAKEATTRAWVLETDELIEFIGKN